MAAPKIGKPHPAEEVPRVEGDPYLPYREHHLYALDSPRANGGRRGRPRRAALPTHQLVRVAFHLFMIPPDGCFFSSQLHLPCFSNQVKYPSSLITRWC